MIPHIIYFSNKIYISLQFLKLLQFVSVTVCLQCSCAIIQWLQIIRKQNLCIVMESYSLLTQVILNESKQASAPWKLSPIDTLQKGIKIKQVSQVQLDVNPIQHGEGCESNAGRTDDLWFSVAGKESCSSFPFIVEIVICRCSKVLRKYLLAVAVPFLKHRKNCSCLPF